MNYNAVISVNDLTSDSGEMPILVSLLEMKDYLRLQGFVDSDSSPSTELGEFDFDDSLLDDLIRSATELIEEKAGLSLYQKTLQAVVTNLCGMVEIPYGPVISVTSVKDVDGNDLSYSVTGNFWKYLKTPLQKEIYIIYEAGYSELPKSIKMDIMRIVAYMYENRYDEGVNNLAFRLCSKYSRKTMIV